VGGRGAKGRRGGAVPTSTRASRSLPERLHRRLLERREEIEQAVLIRVHVIEDPSEVRDPAYLEGLRAAVHAAVDYGLTAVRSLNPDPPPVPPELLVQARLAAQNGVRLDVVLRRYVVGNTLLGDFLIDEVAQASAQAELRRLLRGQAARFERLVSEVSEEYCREERSRQSAHPMTAARRRLALVRRLLDGESLDLTDLGYDLEGSHIATVGQGEGLGSALGEFASQLGCRLLAVDPGEGITWGWLSRERPLDTAEVMRLTQRLFPSGVSLALGDPGEGVRGWRLSHRQASSALAIASDSPEPVTCYRDVALVVAIRKDELLAASLENLYLKPLRQAKDGGKTAKETLRAYFAAARHVSSTAAALGVSRQTVSTRLLAIEEQLGESIDSRATEIDLAIRLEGV
jgi:hypothetical protein